MTQENFGFMSAFQSGAQAVFDKIGATMQTFSVNLEAPEGNGLTDFLENFTASVADTFNKMKETAGAAITNVVVNVKERINGIWENLKERAGGIWNNLKENAGNVFNNVKETFTNVVSSVKERISGVWNNLKESAGNVFNKVKETFTNVVSSVKERIGGVWNNLKESAGGVWNNLKESPGNVFSNVKETFTNVVSSVKERIGGVWENLKESAGGVWNNLKETADNVFSNVKEKFTNVKESLGGIFHNEATSEIQEATLQPEVSEIQNGIQPRLQTRTQNDEVNIEPIQPTAAEQATTGNRIQRMFQKFCDKVEIILPQGTPEEQVDILLNELMRRINNAVV